MHDSQQHMDNISWKSFNVKLQCYIGMNFILIVKQLLDNIIIIWK